MNLESVIQSDISPKEKHISYINTYKRNLENDINEPIFRIGREMKTERLNLWTQWGKETVGQLRENTDVYSMPCIKYVVCQKLLYNTGSSSCCSVMT